MSLFNPFTRVNTNVQSLNEIKFQEDQYSLISANHVRVHANTKRILQRQFENTALQMVTFEPGSQLESIEAFAFQGCRFLKSIQFPPTLVSIGHAAFKDSGLQSIDFGRTSTQQNIFPRNPPFSTKTCLSRVNWWNSSTQRPK